ncbi:class I SAM-dependent methyltransferase [bacterium]|nr:class I SAM-dependent methyltransferase [bacterium]
MEYDPIKYSLAGLIGRSKFLRRCFFLTMDVLFLRAWYVRRELKRLKSGLRGRKTTILDAGMGFGQYSDRMLRMFRNAQLVGLEIDSKHLYGSENYFRKVHPSSKIVLGDVQCIPLKERVFDLILTVDVMEHIEDDIATFGEYFRVLMPGGYLMMHTPRIVECQAETPDATSTSFDFHLTEQGGSAINDIAQRWSVDEHVRDGYRDSEARERLEKAGFKIIRMVHGYGLPGRIAWNLLQRIPLSLLSKSKLILPIVILHLILALPIGLLMMYIDLAKKDHPKGGSLLVVAQRPDESRS